MSLLEEKFKGAMSRFNGNLSTGIGIFAFIVGLIWLFFPVAVINFLVSKERPIVPLCSIWRHWISIAPRLEAIDRELQEMLKRIDSGE